jgi:CHAD domain-containing protein
MDDSATRRVQSALERDGSREPRSYRLLEGEGTPAGVRRIARGRIDHALDELTGASGSTPVEAVHEARKDLKKLRGLLRLARDELGEDAYRRENEAFRDAGRALSPLRDATVVIDTLDAVCADATDETLARACTGLRQALEARAALAESANGADHVRRAVAADLHAVGARASHWPLERDGFEPLAPGLRRVYRQGRRRMAAAEADPTAEALHEWRKRVKDHWYHLTLLRRVWPEALEPAADAAHALSERLGDDHDLAVLADAAGAAGEPLADAIARRRKRLQDEAFALGRRVYAERPAALEARIAAWWKSGSTQRARVF